MDNDFHAGYVRSRHRAVFWQSSMSWSQRRRTLNDGQIGPYFRASTLPENEIRAYWWSNSRPHMIYEPEIAYCTKELVRDRT